MKKNILIIGAGAVGIVYGKYLSDAGHKVTFYVKSKYVEQLSRGETVYHINKDKHLDNPIVFKDFNLVSSFEEVGQSKWDQVYLCISSTALQSFDLAGFKKSLSEESTIVMLQPSVEDYKKLNQVFPAEQIVEGMITLISYTAPLATETASQKGIAYYLPPLMSTPFSGKSERRDLVINTFNEAGISAKAVENVQLESLFPTAFLMSFLTALEVSAWKFQKLRTKTDLLKELKLVSDEIFAALEKKFNTSRPLPFKFIASPRVVKSLLVLAPKVMPLDIETYFEYHFMKVKDQTKLYMQNYLTTAKEMNLPFQNIEKFCSLT